MGKFNMEYVKCSKCGCEYTIKIYEEINIQENASLKEKLLDHRLISKKCKKCGNESLNIYPFLYTDLDKKLLVWFVPTESEKELKEVLDGINEDMDLKEKADSSFMMRVVSNFNELKEKIIIRDLGLDDRIIELIKIYYFSFALEDNQSLENKDIEGMYLNNDGQEMFFEFVFIDSDEMLGLNLSIDFYKEIEKKVNNLIKRKKESGFLIVDFDYAEKLAFKMKRQEEKNTSNK